MAKPIVAIVGRPNELLEIGIFLAGVLSGLLGGVGTVFLGLELG